MKRPTFFLALIATLLSTTSAIASPPLIPPPGQRVYSWAMNAMKAVATPPYIDYQATFSSHGFWVNINCDGSGIARLQPKLGGFNFPRATWHVLLRTSDDFALQGARQLPCRPFPYSPTWSALDDFSDYFMERFESMNVPSPGSSVRPETTPSSKTRTTLPVIAVVTAYANRYYRIHDLGITRIRDVAAYHLQMTALRNPERYPLTDMFVDVGDHRVRAVIFGGGQRGFLAGGGGSATLYFEPVKNYWLVRRGKISVGAHLLFLHQAGYYSFTLHDFSFPTSVPPGEFPPKSGPRYVR